MFDVLPMTEPCTLFPVRFFTDIMVLQGISVIWREDCLENHNCSVVSTGIFVVLRKNETQQTHQAIIPFLIRDATNRLIIFHVRPMIELCALFPTSFSTVIFVSAGISVIWMRKMSPNTHISLYLHSP
jgi:hypothetical protein